MKNNKKGVLVVFSGPSGVGKGTVLKKILENSENIQLSISVTTRDIRQGEKQGREYYFVSKEEFFNRVENDGMLEYAQYCDHYYGTPRKEVENWLDEGKDVVLEIEVEGALRVMKKCKDALSIFILPPSLKELEQRLKLRGTDSNEVIEKRLKKAIYEIGLCEKYDYVVINEDKDKCANSIQNIICSDKFKFTRMKNIINEVLEK